MRLNSFSPYSCSSWRICALTADWERNTFRPASEKLPCFATSTNVLIWSKSIDVALRGRILAETRRKFTFASGRKSQEGPLADGVFETGSAMRHGSARPVAMYNAQFRWNRLDFLAGCGRGLRCGR